MSGYDDVVLEMFIACPSCKAMFRSPRVASTARCPACRTEVETATGLERKRLADEPRAELR